VVKLASKRPSQVIVAGATKRREVSLSIEDGRPCLNVSCEPCQSVASTRGNQQPNYLILMMNEHTIHPGRMHVHEQSTLCGMIQNLLPDMSYRRIWKVTDQIREENRVRYLFKLCREKDVQSLVQELEELALPK